MRNAKVSAAARSGSRDWMRGALHDVAQPLTALECGLFLATMKREGAQAPDMEELRQTIVEALEQCARVRGQIRAMQDELMG